MKASLIVAMAGLASCRTEGAAPWERTIPNEAIIWTSMNCATQGLMAVNETATGVVSQKANVGECYNACLDNFANSKRGISFGGDNSFLEVFNADVTGLGREVEVSACYQMDLTLANGAPYKYIPRYYSKTTLPQDPKTLSVKAINTELEGCKRATNNKNQGTTPGCQAYEWNEGTKTCKQFTGAEVAALDRSQTFAAPEGEIVMSGSLFCTQNPKDYMGQYYVKPGCVVQRDLSIDIKSTVANVEHTEACRSLCAASDECTIFSYDKNTKDCKLAGKNAIYQQIPNPNATVGLKHCRTCAPGFTLNQASNECEVCQPGNYCPGGTTVMTVCPAGSKCPSPGLESHIPCPENEDCSAPGTINPVCQERWYGADCKTPVKCLLNRGVCEDGSCYGFNGNGLCNRCTEKDYAGSMCELNMCSNSEAAKSETVRNAYLLNPKDFDWTVFMPNVSTKQVLTASGQLDLVVQFAPNSYEVDRYNILVNDKVLSTPEYEPDCNRSEVAIVETIYNTRDDNKVGAKVNVEVTGRWRDGYTNIPSEWDTRTATEIRKPELVRTMTHSIKFHAKLNLKITDLNGNALQNIGAQLKAGDTLVTVDKTRNGETSVDIVLPASTSESVDVSVEKVMWAGKEFVMCPAGSSLEDCKVVFVKLSDAQAKISLSHLSTTSSVWLIPDPTPEQPTDDKGGNDSAAPCFAFPVTLLTAAIVANVF